MWFLAPPSAWTRLPLAEAVVWMWRAIGVEPTKETAATSGCARSRVDGHLVAVHDVAARRPAGRPRRPARRACMEADGSFSLGLRMKVLPQAMASGNIHIGTIAGKLNGRDARDDAQRLADRGDVHPVGDLGGQLALELGGDAAGQLDDLQAAGDLAERVGVDLAVLGGDQLGDGVAVGVQQRAVARTAPWCARPARTVPQVAEGVLGGGDRRVDLLGGGERDLGGDLAGGRVGDRAAVARRALDGLATDPVVDGLHCSS